MMMTFSQMFTIACFVALAIYIFWIERESRLVDKDMAEAFKHSIRKKYYEPFIFASLVSEKTLLTNALEAAIVQSKDNYPENYREFNFAAREILVQMKYDLKMLRLQAKANVIVEKMYNSERK
jgi:hypothetical protein